MFYIPEINSTNDYLKELLRSQKLEEGTIVRTDFQTAGKGQVGNNWESERGKNLLFSTVLYPDFVEISYSFILSKMVSVAIVDTLLAENIENISIKWPNDIYIGDKKLAGILIENSLSGNNITQCIIGIGLNLNQEQFACAPNPVSLKQITGKEYRIEDFLSSLKENIFARYQAMIESDEASINTDYFKYLYRKKGFHQYRANDEFFEAKIKTVLPTGQLVLETRVGEVKRFYFKEIEFI